MLDLDGQDPSSKYSANMQLGLQPLENKLPNKQMYLIYLIHGLRLDVTLRWGDYSRVLQYISIGRSLLMCANIIIFLENLN